MQDLERAIEAIAYDVYDDAYIAAFSAATQRVEEQITAVQSRLRPKRVPDCFREAVGLYLQGLRHLDEALGEFETFVEGYDIDSLVTGREFFLTGQDILLAARQSLLSRT